MADSASIFPILIDSRPDYLRECSLGTLLQVPLANGTLLSHVAQRLHPVTRHAPKVLRTFEAGPDYDLALKATGFIRQDSISDAMFWAQLHTYEPSDWLLIVDPSCFPAGGFNPWPILQGLDETPRLTRHLIAMVPTSAGTNERVEFDSEGRVRCVQRYYESVTWTLVRGVSCSLVPVSSLLMAPPAHFDTLAELRKALVATAFPSRDVAITGGVLDLAVEQSYLALNERGMTADSIEDAGLAQLGTVHKGARLIGGVVLQQDAVVEEGATVIGPTVLGSKARVGRGAVVAQCVVMPNVSIAEGIVARQRVVAAAVPAPPVDVFAAAPEWDEGHLALRNEEPESRRLYPVVKRSIEAAVAAIALALLSPLLLLIAALIKLDSKGAVFYGDPREAKGGRLFHCYKFRTMRVGSHAAQRELVSTNQVDGPQFKMQDDPRVTRVGKWLRKTNLDELPQLFNVALGHMSLVGPRPSPFRENQTCVPWRDARLSVRPGITGLWQVCRHDRESGDFHQWIYYDIQYIRHQSFLVDLKILAATLWTGGGRTHVPLSWIIPSTRSETL